MTELRRVVVVGASLAGLGAAQSLRRSGFDRELVIVGDEPHPPYDRPPLSKQYLAGAVDEAKLTLRAAREPEALDATWRLGVRATGIDTGNRLVLVDQGAPEPYDGLVIATGARLRTLGDLPFGGPIHGLRTVDDARRLRAALAGDPIELVVIGFGFIGAEVAATARELGHTVTVVEAAPTPLARVLDPETGENIAELHRSHGVDVRLGVGVDGIDVEGDRATVTLADGDALSADVVVVGIGVSPNTDWLAGSGLQVDDGIVVDEFCRAGEGIVVAGDVARWPHPRFGGELRRIEQWDNAVDQGNYVAKSLLAWAADEDVEPFGPVPWFWSDQYDTKLQLAGVPGRVAATVAPSEPGESPVRRVMLFVDGDDRFCGTLAWNRPRHAIQARQLLADGATLDEAVAALG